MQQKDSTLNKEDYEKVASLKANFEMQQKERERELILKAKETEQNALLNRQRIITVSVTCGGILVLLMGLVVLRGYNQKKKAHELITNQKHIVDEKNKEITDSINYAKRIQNGFLPSGAEMNKALQEHFVLYKPKDIVSGDFYWLADVHTTATDKAPVKVSVIAVVDCTGHGVPGALMSIVGNTLLNQTIRNPEINTPADALNYLNHELPKNLRSQNKGDAIRDGMDMTMCAFDHINQVVYFSGANNPIYIVESGELREVKGEKQPISGSDEYEKKDFTNVKLQLKKGDMVYMFTDGYADQFGGPDEKKLKHKQLKEILVSVSQLPMEEQKEILNNRFEDWKGKLEQVDDVCVIGVRIT